MSNRSFTISVTLEKRKRKKGYVYLLRWKDPVTGSRCSENAGNDRKRAEKERVKKEKQFCYGLYDPEPGKYSISDFEKDFIQSQQHRLKPETLRRYLTSLKAFKRIFPQKEYLQDISPLEAEMFVSKRVEIRKPVSVNTDIRHLKAMFGYAVKWEKLKKNVWETVKFLKEAPKKINTLTHKQEQRVVKAIEESDFSEELRLKYIAMFKIAIQAGLRSGEIRNLRWADLNLEIGEISVQCREEWTTKNYKNRTAFILPKSLHYLYRLKMITGGKPEEMPFQYHGASTVSKLFRKISRSANVTFTLHDCRRTCASRMAEEGVSPQVVKEYLGHADIKTTMDFYTNISKEALRHAMVKAHNPQVKRRDFRQSRG